MVGRSEIEELSNIRIAFVSYNKIVHILMKSSSITILNKRSEENEKNLQFITKDE